MSLWFMDAINGDDANDGKASVAVAFAGKTLNCVGGVYSIVDETVAAAAAAGQVLYLTSATSPAQAAWWQVKDVLGDIVTVELFSGTWVETSRVDCCCAGGPFGTYAALRAAAAPGDTCYVVAADGTLTAVAMWSAGMSVVTETMLEDRIGQRELIRLTDDGGLNVVDAEVLARGIAEGEGEILGRIGQKYTLPLALSDAHTSAMVLAMLLDVVVYRLFVHREQGAPDEIAAAYRRAIEWASQIAAGELGLAGETPLGEALGQAGQVIVQSSTRVISRETMQGL